MFLLFRQKLLIQSIPVHHLHSNMFLLFHSTVKCRLCCVSLFTFQYVSIISVHPLHTSDVTSGIYIPICFYYFMGNLLHFPRLIHLHSNMFLLFRKLETTIHKTFLIYIPICFYYFGHLIS